MPVDILPFLWSCNIESQSACNSARYALLYLRALLVGIRLCIRQQCIKLVAVRRLHAVRTCIAAFLIPLLYDKVQPCVVVISGRLRHFTAVGGCSRLGGHDISVAYLYSSVLLCNKRSPHICIYAKLRQHRLAERSQL